MSLYDPCDDCDPGTDEPAVYQSVQLNNKAIQSVLLPLFTQIEQQMTYQNEQLSLFMKSVNRYVKQSLKSQQASIDGVSQEAYTQLVNRVAEQGLRLQMLEQMLRGAAASSQPTSTVAVGSVPVPQLAPAAGPTVTATASPTATAAANPTATATVVAGPAPSQAQPASVPQAQPSSIAVPVVNLQVTGSGATATAGSASVQVTFPGDVAGGSDSDPTAAGFTIDLGGITGTVGLGLPAPSGAITSTVINNTYAAAAASFNQNAASQPAAAASNQPAALAPTNQLEPSVGYPPPVDLDQPLAFLFAPDDDGWRQRAAEFYGSWLQMLIAAPTLTEFIAASKADLLQATEQP